MFAGTGKFGGRDRQTIWIRTYLLRSWSTFLNPSTKSAAFFQLFGQRFDLNIGWAMRNLNSNPKVQGGSARRYKKACLGFVYCANEACKFYENCDIGKEPNGKQTAIR